MEKATFIVDTREQEALSFDAEKVSVIRRALPAGDYSIEGYEDSVAVERKTLEDFVSTVIRSRKRFYKELRRLADYDSACVVVEADLKDLFDRSYPGGAHPNSVFGAAVSIIVDFGIPVFFCGSRQLSCRFIESYLLRFLKKASQNDKEKSNDSGDDPGHD